jgi:fibronectin-binding autotransporter adhesin
MFFHLKTAGNGILHLVLLLGLTLFLPLDTAYSNTISSWNGGTGNWNNAANWNGVPLNSTVDAVIFSGGSDSVTLDISPTISSLTLGGAIGSAALQAFTPQTLEIVNGLTVNTSGAIIFQGGSTLKVDASSTNAGFIELENGSTLMVTGNLANSGTLTTGCCVGAPNTLTVTGTLTNAAGALIRLDQAGANSDVANIGTLVNNGTVRIGRTATLNLTNQPGGITDVLAGSTLEVHGSLMAGGVNGLAQFRAQRRDARIRSRPPEPA